MPFPPLNQRVCWREGICVSPQHFQQQERFFESQLQARFAATAPTAWGVHQIDVDAAALGHGDFSLIGLKAVMPEGLVVSLGQAVGCTVPSRPIAEHFDERKTRLRVYLALPKGGNEHANYARPNTQPKEDAKQSSDLRFHIDDQTLQDNGRNESHRRIEVLTPQLRLLFESESRDGQDCLAIAELIRTPGQGYALNPDFVPPCLNLSAAPSVRRELHRLLELALSCYRELHSRRPQRDEVAARDLMIYLRMSAISTHLPDLEQCSRDALVSPALAHSTLARLAGQLWALFDNPEPVRVPPYQHDDLTGSFVPLISLTRDLLTQCVSAPRPFVELSLVSDGQGLWTTTLDDPRLAQAERFLLSVTSATAANLTADMVQTRCKIASKTQIAAVVDRAVSGARLMAPIAPAGIALRPGEVHLEFDLHDGYWRDLFFERAFALYADDQVLTPEHQPRLLALLPDSDHRTP